MNVVYTSYGIDASGMKCVIIVTNLIANYHNDMKNKKGELFRKEIKDCADCGRKMTVIIYTDKNKKNRGGHYFGKIGICSKKENEKMYKSSTKKFKMGGYVFNSFKYEAKPYKYLEHWECPKCYWGKRNTKVS